MTAQTPTHTPGGGACLACATCGHPLFSAFHDAAMRVEDAYLYPEDDRIVAVVTETMEPFPGAHFFACQHPRCAATYGVAADMPQAADVSTLIAFASDQAKSLRTRWRTLAFWREVAARMGWKLGSWRQLS